MSEFVAQVKQWIGENHRTLGIALGGLVITFKVIVPILRERSAEYQSQQVLKKWENAPKDVVILHTLSRGKTIPNLSPFAMKLETFLRIAKIPYELDFESPMGPVGKTPWISLNGEHVVDSQLIINFLTSKYDIKLGNYTEEQRALGKAVRIMMDEYLYWGIVLWRYVQSEGKGLNQIFDMPPFAIKLFYRMVNMKILEYSFCQGVGRHSPEQINFLMKDALKSASLLLGSKPFLLGEEPCEEDCSLFGSIGMVRWATPGSPYEAYLKDELPNLMDYCDRMKSCYWSDWETCLSNIY